MGHSRSNISPEWMGSEEKAVNRQWRNEWTLNHHPRRSRKENRCGEHQGEDRSKNYDSKNGTLVRDETFREILHHATRIRGSTTLYRRSVIRLKRRTIAEEMTKTPSNRL